MHSAPLRRVLSVLSLCLAAAPGCGLGGGPGLARFETLHVHATGGVEDGQLALQMPIHVSFRWPEGLARDAHDCALASRNIVATLNGRPMQPLAGVEVPGTSWDNVDCLAPEFYGTVTREDALREGGRVTVVVREGEEEVRLVAEGMLAVRGVMGQERWTVPSGVPTVLPWSHASDDLSALRGFSLRDDITMTAVEGGLQVRGLRDEYVARRLIVSGDVGVGVATCEGIARCSARLPVHQVLDLDIF